MGKLINNLDLRGPPIGIDDRCAAKPPRNSRHYPRNAIDSDPVFGTILLVVLTLCVGAVTGGWGLIPFGLWAFWLATKPFDDGR